MKKLTSKVVSRDVLHYRKLTDLPLEEKDTEPPMPAATSFLEMLARGEPMKYVLLCWGNTSDDIQCQ